MFFKTNLTWFPFEPLFFSSDVETSFELVSGTSVILDMLFHVFINIIFSIIQVRKIHE